MSDKISLELRAEIEDLYARYARILDEGPLDLWPSLFLTEGSYRVVTRENADRDLPLALILCESRAAIEDRIYAIENTTFALPRQTRHLITNIMAVASENEGEWMAEANFAVFESLEERTTLCHSTGRYRDALARDETGRLCFASKLCVCDSPLVPNSLIVPL